MDVGVAYASASTTAPEPSSPTSATASLVGGASRALSSAISALSGSILSLRACARPVQAST